VRVAAALELVAEAVLEPVLAAAGLAQEPGEPVEVALELPLRPVDSARFDHADHRLVCYHLIRETGSSPPCHVPREASP
jgi:hypothetical protein